MIWKILGHFVKQLTGDGKYSLLNTDNLLQHLQMQLSQKQKTFFELFLVFSKYRFNFEHFHKEITHVAYVFLKLRTPKNVGRYMSKKSRFRGPFEK